MSYARWSAECDVYSYPSSSHDGTKYIVCAACDLIGSIAYTADEAAAHAKLHVDRGDRIPAHLLDPAIYLDDSPLFELWPPHRRPAGGGYAGVDR